MIILDVKNLTKSFGGVKALNGVSVSFEEGKITSLIGPNGSGKSTLFNVISGFYKFDGGRIIVSSADIGSIDPHEGSIYGFTRTFQEIRLFNQVKVIDNIVVVLTERGVFGSLFEKHKDYHFKIAEEVLKKTGLWEKRNTLSINLSYGQRKLLEIARALAMSYKIGKKEIFFFDEPFAGLFPEMKKIVVSVMKEIRDQGKTVILVEHNMDLIRELSDYVYVLDSGELLAEGKPNDVLSRRDVLEAYLGE